MTDNDVMRVGVAAVISVDTRSILAVKLSLNMHPVYTVTCTTVTRMH